MDEHFDVGDRVIYKGFIRYVTVSSKSVYGLCISDSIDGTQHHPVDPRDIRKAFQTCKDCDGHGVVSDRLISRYPWHDCETCDGTGRINRTSPYRLRDGSWSDGVIRTHRINTLVFAIRNHGRYHVYKDHHYFLNPKWRTFMGIQQERYNTHNEAVLRADGLARGTQDGFVYLSVL